MKHPALKKICDNCSKELSKLALFSPSRRIYRYNNAILCEECLTKISQREQVEKA